MKNWMWLCVVLVAVVVALGADDIKKPRGVFSSLTVGQHVTLKDKGRALTILSFDEETPLAHKVIEVGADYIVLQDVAGVTETMIPVYSIKGIVKVRTKGR